MNVIRRHFESPEEERAFRDRTFWQRLQEAMYRASVVEPNGVGDDDFMPQRVRAFLNEMGLEVIETHIPHCTCGCHRRAKFAQGADGFAYTGCVRCTRYSKSLW